MNDTNNSIGVKEKNMKNCPKIVNRGLKIDLHIHSIYSSSKYVK